MAIAMYRAPPRKLESDSMTQSRTVTTALRCAAPEHLRWRPRRRPPPGQRQLGAGGPRPPGRPARHLVHDSGHELRVRLLAGQELADDLVHDVLGREEVVPGTEGGGRGPPRRASQGTPSGSCVVGVEPGSEPALRAPQPGGSWDRLASWK